MRQVDGLPRPRAVADCAGFAKPRERGRYDFGKILPSGSQNFFLRGLHRKLYHFGPRPEKSKGEQRSAHSPNRKTGFSIL